MPVADSRPFPDRCPVVNLDSSQETQSLYGDYLEAFSADHYSALNVQASSELDSALMELYGTADKAAVVALWQSNPLSIPVDGSYGLSHAAQALLALETLRLSGATNAQIQAEADKQIAYWYSREAMARCKDGIDNWMNPLNWSLDSRLDYMAVVLFVGWYIGQL